jgi:hypothetical protein
MWENQENNGEQNSEPEVVKPSYEALEADLAQMTREKNSFEFSTKIHKTNADKLTNQREKLAEYLKENWESLDLHAEEISEIFDLDVTSTKTFRLTVNVDVEVTANSPAYDWDNFDGSEIDLDISASIAYGYNRGDLDDVTVDDHEVTDCEEN